jgi:hypothetical protein
VRALTVAIFVLAWTTSTRAQPSSIEDMLPLTNDPNDPIGVDREALAPKPAADSGRSKPAARSASDFGPQPAPLQSTAGEVLTAVESVHERTHKEHVEWSPGLAEVQAELEFENAGEKPAEVVYRLAVPANAALASFEVCNAKGCRAGVPEADGKPFDAYDDALQARPIGAAGLPAGDARAIHDARGVALRLRAAPVSRSQWLRMRVSYVIDAPMHAGVARITLPARGMDPRAARLSLTAHANGVSDVRANDLPLTSEPLEADAWSSVELQAADGGGHDQLWRYPCGKDTCLRAYVASPAAQEAPAEIFLAIDASPSTEGRARSRLLVTVAALLARAPAGSHLRALRFASQAQLLVKERKEPRELALSAFAPISFEAELGAATRFESAWQQIEASGFKSVKGKKLVVIVGDGGITTGPARPFDAAKRAGVEVAVVNVADRASEPALAHGAMLTGGAVVDAGAEAELAAHGGDADRLEERVAAVFEPSRGVVHAGGASFSLRAGDSVLWEGRGNAAPQWSARHLAVSAPPAAIAHALARPALFVAVDHADLPPHKPDRPEGQTTAAQRGVYCDRRGPAQRRSGLSTDALPVLLAEERAVCAIPVIAKKPAAKTDDDDLGSGMPSSPLLSMLRQRIMPVARGCFRRDRAGRADYQVRAVFEFQLADREVVSARVEGTIAEDLRQCLLSAVDSLAVPRFTGKVIVRYPLVTEREALPAQIELTTDTAGRLDAVIGPARTARP